MSPYVVIDTDHNSIVRPSEQLTLIVDGDEMTIARSRQELFPTEKQAELVVEALAFANGFQHCGLAIAKLTVVNTPTTITQTAPSS